MKYINSVKLYAVLLGALLSWPALGTHTELTKEQAMAYTQCAPEDYDRWLLVGGERANIGEIINKVLEASMRLSKTLVMLDGQNTTPYILTSHVILKDKGIGICTKPPEGQKANAPVPFNKQAQIRISDQESKKNDHAAFVVHDETQFNMVGIRVDASDWSSDFPVISGLDRAVINVENSHIARLKSSPGSWRIFQVWSIIATSPYKNTQNTASVIIKDSSLFQGMELGRIVDSWSGELRVLNSRLVVANSASVTSLMDSDVEIIGSTIHGCGLSVSLNSLGKLGRVPAGFDEFCSRQIPGNLLTRGVSAAAVHQKSTVNIQNVHFSGWWGDRDGAITLSGVTLKTDPGRNLGNTASIQHGTLCNVQLAQNSPGAIEFDDQLCPSQGHPLAESQLSPPAETVLFQPTTAP